MSVAALWGIWFNLLIVIFLLERIGNQLGRLTSVRLHAGVNVVPRRSARKEPQ